MGEFASRRLAHEESVYFFMRDLKRLAAVICGGAGGGEAFVTQAFISGLPEAAIKSVEAKGLRRGKI